MASIQSEPSREMSLTSAGAPQPSQPLIGPHAILPCGRTLPPHRLQTSCHNTGYEKFDDRNHFRREALVLTIERSAFREAMPRFYFHIRCHGETLSKDELGLDFPNVVSAHNEALRAGRNLDGAFAAQSRDPKDCTIEIEDASGELVFSLSFAAIFNGQAKALDPHSLARKET
jgi:hypothetical protein